MRVATATVLMSLQGPSCTWADAQAHSATKAIQKLGRCQGEYSTAPPHLESLQEGPTNRFCCVVPFSKAPSCYWLSPRVVSKDALSHCASILPNHTCKSPWLHVKLKARALISDQSRYHGFDYACQCRPHNG
ncbi:hypothetical protein EJ08DRAFT_210228 [Tothia fuscella]|uniref:Uncharacterized protein n=1 Tax=Tothia fuscella TaxID=1048955 RepID=A0A9P4NSD1_9PEZI|nr:hypothetical protein EJ08DRAFT_210228 [Tothia fuscella]